MPPKTNRSAYKKHSWSGGQRKKRQVAAGLRRYHNGESSRIALWRNNERDRSQQRPCDLNQESNDERGMSQQLADQLLEENLSASCTADNGDETSIKVIQELDPLRDDESSGEVDTTTTEAKQECEDSETGVTQASDTFKSNYDEIGQENGVEKSQLEEDSVIGVEQFVKGCEFYLTPELANYVKTQIKQPTQ